MDKVKINKLASLTKNPDLVLFDQTEELKGQVKQVEGKVEELLNKELPEAPNPIPTLEQVILTIKELNSNLPKFSDEEILNALSDLKTVLDKPIDFPKTIDRTDEVLTALKLLKEAVSSKEIPTPDLSNLELALDALISKIPKVSDFTFPEIPLENERVAVSLSDSDLKQLTKALGKDVKVSVSGGGGIEAASAVNNTLQNYKLTDTDTSSSTKYLGFTDKDGNWYIQSVSSSGAFRYANGSANYSGNWTGREGLSYDYFFNVF